ncbi:Cytochrome P450 [Operophtera brumata]|uniref:unspecific monooxygenase n=1 Tax=Operophtera brumata TaxID=104452 RepID=A0A0L7KTG3_OPEBR|nr:Cytochrome P450 [Operophtera brumata]
MIIEIIIFVITTILAYYFYVHKKIQMTLRRKGIKYLPGLPFFGNILKSTFLRRHVLDDIEEIYKAFPEERPQNLLRGDDQFLQEPCVQHHRSSAATLVMCIHELALSPQVQEKLFQELVEHRKREGKLSYDNIGELNYLDCVLNETTRKWSAAIVLDRVCLKAYELPPPREGGKPVQLKEGDLIYNVVNAIHMDPKHFPEPKTFDPERFSDENKHKIKPFSFMPFGSGPRNCIGSRFALLELKVMIHDLVLNYKIVKTAKTLDPLRLQPSDFNLRAFGGGTRVQFERRE